MKGRRDTTDAHPTASMLRGVCSEVHVAVVMAAVAAYIHVSACTREPLVLEYLASSHAVS